MPFNGYITPSKTPFRWLFDFTDSSIANEEGTMRWDIDGEREPNIDKPLILWNFKNNVNQTSFTMKPNGDLCVLGLYPLTVYRNRVVVGGVTEIIKIHRASFHVFSKPISHTVGTPFKFVSYNILTGLPRFENDMSDYIREEDRTWGLGRERLVKTEVLSADLAVVVECTKAQLADILRGTHIVEAHMELKINEQDGTAILFNKSRFALVNKHSQRLTDGGGQICVNVVLFDLHAQKLVCVTGLHLKSGDASVYERRRLVELESAIKITNTFIARNKYGTIPQVLCGDLNSDSKLHTGVFSVANALRRHEFVNIGDERPTYNFWQESVYDYIYIKGEIEAYAYDVDRVTALCPNEEQGSDHLAIRCNFIL